MGLIAVTLVVLAAMFAAVYFWSDGIIERANRLINSITAPDRVETPADDTEDPDEDGDSGEDLSGESTDTDGTASDEEKVPSEDGEALN